MSLSPVLCSADNQPMIDETFLAWFAGFYEGEGTIHLSPARKHGGRYLRMTIGSTDRDVLERVQAGIGGSIGSQKRYKDHHKPMFVWRLTKTDEVAALLVEMLPHLGQRRRADAEAAIAGQRFGPIPILPLADRFWAKVDKDDSCWLWTGHIDRFGFGTWCPTADGKSRRQAHRQAIELLHGAVPPRVRNTCGAKHCVNPDHWTADRKVTA